MIGLESRGQTLIARLAGELDLQVADELRGRLDEALEAHGAVHLVLNLEGVSFIDSACLGVILGRYKRIASNQGTLVFVAIPPRVRRVLELSGLMRIGREFPTEEAALTGTGQEVDE
jgi:stage II sporulation protein AA (anti-sigma F factor antagonist)